MNRHLKQLLKEGQLTVYTPKNVEAGQPVRASTQFYLIGDVIHQVNKDVTNVELEAHSHEVKRIVNSVQQSISGYAKIALIISFVLSAFWTVHIVLCREFGEIMTMFRELQWREIFSLLWGYASFLLPVLTKAVSRFTLYRLLRKYI